MSDTDATFNFLISMIYTQLFNLLCEKADDVYGGRLPVHVRCLIDEAANIGQIPNLEKLVATILEQITDWLKEMLVSGIIHNHIIFNSTTLDCAHKFKDFYYSGLAIQRLSDLICLEHGLSIIEKVPYSQRQKRTIYEKRTTYRDQIRQDIDTILKKPPTDFDAFLRKLEEMGYEVKRGKYASIKGKDQQRFVRLNSLGEGYAEEDIRAVIAGEKKHRARIKSPLAKEDRVFNLLLVMTVGIVLADRNNSVLRHDLSQPKIAGGGF